MGFLKKANFHEITNLEDDERERAIPKQKNRKTGDSLLDGYSRLQFLLLYLFIYLFFSFSPSQLYVGDIIIS